jgi:methylated-DNA-[protein]-cysteine S-methyltransferase
MNIDQIETPIGTLRLQFNGQGLHAVTIQRGAHRDSEMPAGTRCRYPQRAVFERYFAGETDALSQLTIVMNGTDFQLRVWRALRRIPPGRTLTYAGLAKKIGNDHAMRAVGTANGRNPLHIVVPCHRVIRSDAKLGGFSAGPDTKRWLLEHEGARFRL